MSQDASPLPLAKLAARLLETARAGTLSTHSETHAGFPFGSLAPFAVARDGTLVLALSKLAEHTRNVTRDPRASLFVQDPTAAPDAQSAARIALLGRVARSEDARAPSDRACYVARFADAADYFTKLDFDTYVLTIEHVRLVGGFGRIAWLEGTTVVAELRR